MKAISQAHTTGQKEEMVVCLFSVPHSYRREDMHYVLRFPVSELASAITACGWGVVRGIKRTAAVAAEIGRIEKLDAPPTPDAEAWFLKYATGYHKAVATGII